MIDDTYEILDANTEELRQQMQEKFEDLLDE